MSKEQRTDRCIGWYLMGGQRCECPGCREWRQHQANSADPPPAPQEEKRRGPTAGVLPEKGADTE